MMRLLFSLWFIFITISCTDESKAGMLPNGSYYYEIIVLDTDEKYPATVQFIINDSELKSSKVHYPSYECTALIKKVEHTTNGMLLTEKMLSGSDRCEPSKYLIRYSSSSKRNDFVDENIQFFLVVTNLGEPLESLQVKRKSRGFVASNRDTFSRLIVQPDFVNRHIFLL